MINGTGRLAYWLAMIAAVGSLGLGALAISRAPRAPGQPYPATVVPPAMEPPPCLTEDGGPVPCLWDGPNRGVPGEPGARTGDRITITQVP